MSAFYAVADGDDVTWLYSILHVSREESARGEGEHTAIDSLSRYVADSIVAAGFSIELISWGGNVRTNSRLGWDLVVVG